MAKGIKRLLIKTIKNVEQEIRDIQNPNDLFSKGLANEGYLGGYLDALMDIQLALNGISPTRNHWWEKGKK